MGTRPLRASLRWPAALALLVASAAHVPLIGEHLEEAPYMGVLFLLMSVVSALLAVLLVVWDSPWVWRAVGLVTLLAVVAFLASRTVGLPELADDVGNWTEPLGYPALLAELVACGLTVATLRRRARTVAGSLSEAGRKQRV